MAEVVLAVEGLRTEFATGEGPSIVAVDDLSFTVRRGETLCIVGESGCGKSLTALSILRLLPRPYGRIGAGRVLLDNQDLVRISDAEMRSIRGRAISMIFQEPMSSLNPVLTIGRQIAETVMVHEGLAWDACMARALEMLRQVRIPEPERRLHEYPHQLSGGMRQRIMIAMALACRPRLLLADEPTTALDVTIQAQILDLIRELQQETGTAVILITHDLGVVAEMAERVLVMYAGHKVEEGSVEEIFDAPTHPYTRGLMAAMPHLSGGQGHRGRLNEIAGVVPALNARPPGCAFAPRCDLATDHCRITAPPIVGVGGTHSVACWVTAGQEAGV